MWNIKHLLIGILFAVCAVVCVVAWLFFDGGSITSGFIFGGTGGKNTFAPIGAVIFTFFSVMFFRNARR